MRHVVAAEVIFQDLQWFRWLELETDERSETLVHPYDHWIFCQLVLHPRRVAYALVLRQLPPVVILSFVVDGATNTRFLQLMSTENSWEMYVHVEESSKHVNYEKYSQVGSRAS